MNNLTHFSPSKNKLNGTCCSNFRMSFKNLKGIKTILLSLFLLLFINLTATAQTEFLPICQDEAPDAPYTLEEVADLYSSQCENEAIEVTLSSTMSGNDCSWTLLYRYDVKCGNNDLTPLKVTYNGGDESAPELAGDLPDGASNIDACFEDIPVGPTEAEIAALFQDNCGNVNVSKSGVPSGDDCNWNVTYKYTITDDCGNQADFVDISFSGGDMSPPILNKDAQLPTGESGLNLCFDEVPEGPTEAEIAALFSDECGEVVVSKDLYFKGDDCGWKGEITYTVQDTCGNSLDPIVLAYSGSDSEDPVLDSYPEDFTVSCIDLVPAAESINFTDNCKVEGKLKATATDDLSGLGDFCEGGVIIRTWTGTDDCGNSTSHSITITVEGAPAPEFEQTTNLTIDCTLLAEFNAPLLSYSNGGQGACDISGQAEGTPEPFDGDCGEFNVNYSYTDECGRTITATLIVIVVDNTNPEIVDVTDFALDGYNTEWPANLSTTWTDNCADGGSIDSDGGGEVTTSDDGCSQSRVYTFTVTDNCGNSDTETTTVTRDYDVTDPEINDLPDFMLELCNEDFPSKLTTTWTDNCSEGGSVDSDGGGDVMTSDDGCTQTVVYTFTVTDDAGNTDTETTTVTREYDETNPEIADVADYTLDGCNADWPANLSTTWTDNCADGGSIDSDGGGEVTTSDDGCSQSRVYTFTVTDDCGNTDTETTTVTRDYDVTDPEIADLADYTLDGCNAEWPTKLTTTWTDNCAAGGSIDSDAGVPDGESADGCIQYRLYTFTVTDDCGNSDTETTRVAREYDETNPEIADVADYTLEGCNAEWPLVLSTTWSDNCADGGSIESDGGGEITTSADGCSQSRVYTFTVTDDCGNSDTETTTVTRDYDETAPEIADVPDFQLDTCNEDWPTKLTTTWSDNCAAGGSIDSDAGVPDGESADGCIQYRLYTFTVTDDCGNSDTETTRVAREYDETKPEIADVPDFQLDTCNEDWPTKLTTTWTDNCADGGSVESDAGVADGESADGCIQYRLYTFTVTDDCGNSDTETTRVAREYDMTDPVFINIPDDIVLDCSEDIPAMTELEWTDNCSGTGKVFGEDSEIEGACGIITRTWTYTDECGNTATATQMITIEDNEPPVLECVCDIMVGNSESTDCEAYVNINNVIATDNCGEPTLTYSHDINGTFPIGDTVVTVTAEDSCGNKSTCEFTITVVNNCMTDCCEVGNKPSVMTFTYTGEDCSATMTTQGADKYGCNGDPAMAPTVYIIASSGDNGSGEVYFSGEVNLNEFYTISAANAGQSQLNNNTIITIYDSEGGNILQVSNFHASCSQPLGSGDQFGANLINGIQFDDGYVCGEVDAPPIPEDCCDLGSKPSIMTFTYTGEDCSASMNTQDPSKAECLGDPAMSASVFIVV
ncbi:MAG: HYR domain-containing protein, partial [Flavobacteriaceae bacterium]|nr:HYR domain-containing protein [Flavobacteriaceae bacterium]